MTLNKKERMDIFDPYELCPCGSDQKFKFCCYQNAKTAKDSTNKYKDYSEGRIQHLVKKMWDDTDFEVCLAFNQEECKPLIKNAHALQNNKILNRISEDGHVFTISSNVTKQRINADFKKISRNKASTFFGFCDYHDNEIFKPIEQKEYLGEPIQNFLFAFRAFCLEYHRIIRKFKTIRDNFKENPSFMLDPFGVYMYRIAEFDVNDSETEYKLFKYNFNYKHLNNIVTIERRLNYEVEFAVSSSFAVKDNLYGNEMNDIFSIEKDTVPNIYINIFPVENETVIIMSYNIKYETVYGEYFNQIRHLTDEELEAYLNFLVINYTENVFFSPRLIDKLDGEQKESLLGSFQSSIDLNKTYELLKDGKYFKFDLFLQN